MINIFSDTSVYCRYLIDEDLYVFRVRREFGCFFFVLFYLKEFLPKMRVVSIALCVLAIKFEFSHEYDELIHALTKVFAQKHVQTVTDLTCWPSGDFSTICRCNH